ncbi:MAG TPA: S9 family peptidase [Acidimicrobiales bacterium]|nr:S9 family peptidase [Acidimicrobiales bacterium]
MSPTPPVAPRRPTTITAHGDERVDDWAWLRSDDRSDAEVLALLEAENEHVQQALAHTEALQAELFAEMKARIKETDLSVPFHKGKRWFYSRTEEGQQYPILCRTDVEPPADLPAGEPVAGEEVLLDMNVLAGDSDYFGMGAYDLSPSQDLLLYSTDHDGSERFRMQVRDLRTGKDLAEVIPETTYGTAWAGDDVFFYVRQDAAMRPHQVWRHAVGTDPADDVLVYEDPDERFFVSVGLSLTEQWVQITSGSKVTTEEHLIPAADPLAAPRCVQPRQQDLEYDVTHAPTPDEDRFLILTNADGAVNFKLMSAPAATPDRSHWTEVVGHRPDVKLEGVTAFAEHLVRYERREGVRRIVATGYVDGVERELEMPEPVYDTGPATNAEFETTTLRFSYTSLVTPGTVYDEDLRTGQRTLLKQTEVLGGHDPSAYETGRLWATAPDGTQVPISYVHRSGITHDGSAPCLLYGYGSYEACMDPTFSILRLSLLDRGFVFAIAHIRGGGELGRPWYDDGKELHKRNTFSDFIACAEHLVAEGFTAPERLVARGGSAGGLLMGAVTNLRPDLFRAVVAEVPFVDCLTTILDETLPLTVTEWEEWGNPIDDPEVYAYMKGYSPYDNVEAKPYPAILATGGLNDPRVSYWEPAKWVQKLRAATTSGNPIYLKTEMGAGHQGPSGRYDAWKDEAFVFAFILDALGMVPRP